MSYSKYRLLLASYTVRFDCTSELDKKEHGKRASRQTVAIPKSDGPRDVSQKFVANRFHRLRTLPLGYTLLVVAYMTQRLIYFDVIN